MTSSAGSSATTGSTPRRRRGPRRRRQGPIRAATASRAPGMPASGRMRRRLLSCQRTLSCWAGAHCQPLGVTRREQERAHRQGGDCCGPRRAACELEPARPLAVGRLAGGCTAPPRPHVLYLVAHNFVTGFLSARPPACGSAGRPAPLPQPQSSADCCGGASEPVTWRSASLATHEEVEWAFTGCHSKPHRLVGRGGQSHGTPLTWRTAAR